ncbi:hypothetical protein Q4512_03105 [Oceanihabitans sp. 2_MG-2023]|uniref:hypothetical protein n=1 Tax=Oceanihabitans sp. 2_MG-2023 TaxID=3062661 RepID=UPI0026E20E76|nr:hypothetical protein [Oceanihabitans sp. 2_MG-2023]MDO6595886.1 hypothetical protein [Oceanihabitans sp. 2_MG-2023]
MLINKIIILSFVLLFFSCQEKETQLGVKVSSHFNNADATIIQCSDQYYDNSATYNKSRQYSAVVAEFESLKHNIPIHVFEEKVERGLKEFLEMGRGGVSAYYPSCSENYRASLLDSILDNLKLVNNRRPTTLAYGCGKNYYYDSLPNYILGARNSSLLPVYALKEGVGICTYYGKDAGNPSIYPVGDFSFLRNRPSASKSWANVISDGLSEKESLSFIKKEVKKTITNKGFYLDFMHWHINEIKGKNAQQFIPKLFKTLNEAIGSSYIAKVDYNEALEYLYGKQTIDSVSLFENKDAYIMRVYINRKKKEIDYNVIRTPISFETEIKTTESSLMEFWGNNIQSVTKVKDKIIFNALIDYTKKLNKFIIYKQANKQTIFLPLEYEVSFNDSIIQSNYPIKISYFKKEKRNEDYKVEIVDRSLKFKKEHALRFDRNNIKYNYYAGVINKLGESKLIKI